MENGLSKLFNFRGYTIDVSDQAVFTLNYYSPHDDECKKTNVSDSITADQRRSVRFLSFMMKFHPYQADKNCKQSHMDCRAGIQLSLDVDGIYDSIYTQMLKTSHYFIVHLADLDHGRKTEIGTLNKEKGYIFSECCTDSFRGKFL